MWLGGGNSRAPPPLYETLLNLNLWYYMIVHAVFPVSGARRDAHAYS